MRKKECFTSLHPRDRQSEQNDTDEPPSPFVPFGACTGLNRLYKTPFSAVPVNWDLPMFSLSKNRIFERIKTLSFPANRFVREPSASADDYYEPEDFIISRRSKITVTFKWQERHKEPQRNGQKCNGYFVTTPKRRGRIKTIIFKQKRSM